MKKTIWIDGMTCMGCSGRVERLLNALDGVHASVSLEDKKAIVEAENHISEDLLTSTIENAGFTVKEIQ